jgi:hypothetical protein
MERCAGFEESRFEFLGRHLGGHGGSSIVQMGRPWPTRESLRASGWKQSE